MEQGQIENERWKFSKNQAKAHKTQQKLMEKELKTLLSFPSTEETIKQISEIHEKLLASKSAQKTAFYNDNEKPTKYFFNLENSRQSQKNKTELIDDKGNVHTSKNQILNHIAKFYTKLYTEKPIGVHAQQKLLDSIHRRLPTDVKPGIHTVFVGC